eukprot:scaffold4113_cov99-Isochrysis_galbana.AAC.1
MERQYCIRLAICELRSSTPNRVRASAYATASARVAPPGRAPAAPAQTGRQCSRPPPPSGIACARAPPAPAAAAAAVARRHFCHRRLPRRRCSAPAAARSRSLRAGLSGTSARLHPPPALEEDAGEGEGCGSGNGKKLGGRALSAAWGGLNSAGAGGAAEGAVAEAEQTHATAAAASRSIWVEASTRVRGGVSEGQGAPPPLCRSTTPPLPPRGIGSSAIG